MKKNLLLTTLALASCIFISSCSKEKTSIEEPIDTVEKPAEQTRYVEEDPAFFKDLFVLDYEKQSPEKSSNAVKLNLDGPSLKGSLKDVSIIPGIRELSQYETNYIDHLDKNKTIRPTIDLNNDAFKKEKGSFEIADWGPQKKLPALVSKPSFFVVFTHPVKATTSLTEVMETSNIISISPPIKGIYRWYGSRHIAFEAKENINPLQKYTITVNENVTSLGGEKLKEEKQFFVFSEPLKIKSFYPGYTWAKKHNKWINKNDVIPEGANEVLIRFNYPVTVEQLKPYMSAKVGKKESLFTLAQNDEKSLLVTLEGAIPFDSDVLVKIEQPIDDNRAVPLFLKYHTLRDFTYKSYKVKKSQGKYLNPVYISFSHMVDKNTVLSNIKTNPAMDITEKNLEVWDTTILLHSLPVTFDSSYSITIKDGIKDEYGRSILKSSLKDTLKVTVPNAATYVEYLSWGSKMLESQFSPRLLIEYQNMIKGSSYTLKKDSDPLNHSFQNPSDFKDKIAFPLEPRNTRRFEEINLNPYLKNGKGWVVLDSLAILPSRWRKAEFYDSTHWSSIQVTDLGITVRYGINKAVVWVTSLKTGKPIENAEVFFFDKERIPSTVSKNTALASAKTDKNGLAVLDFPSLSSAATFFKHTNPAVLVKKENDKAVFSPKEHSPWREGIYNSSYPESSIREKQKTFMFTDRGLYQPGEVVTFKGIDKTKQLSSYTPYKGSYSIRVEEDGWWETSEIYSTSGETTENGGFWNSFTIPEDTPPGNYCIRYKRFSGSGREAKLRFMIAHFERVKYQSSIQLPTTPVITGDTLKGDLKATYLSGGGLSSAHYEGSWFKEPFNYSTNESTFKNYSFGPLYTHESRSEVGEFVGNLSVNGEATINCKTGTDDLPAIPYRYIAQASITDTSNQKISTAKDVIVHPSSYYIGISKPLGINGFPKSGTTISFKYMLASIDGKILKDTSKKGSSFSVELLRENWKAVQRRGAQGSIYSSYQKETVVESTKKIASKLEDTISITPKNTGRYILKISGEDDRGRTVKTEYSFYVTGSNYVFWGGNNSSSLRLTPNQSLYNPGDTAKILLESPLPKGDYLITVEREGIFTQEIRHFDESCATIDIKIAKNYFPVVYVSVCSYSVRTKKPDFEYGEDDTDKPKGYYGATELKIDQRIKAFSIDIVAEKPSYKPGEEAHIKLLATKGGKPVKNAEITLMAVDRGVLDLINYHVPNPIDFFYSPENYPLCCRGGDSRSLLIDPVTYEIKNLQGGDGAEGDKDDERKDFNPTAVFLPQLITNEKGEVEATFTLPDSLTTYRVTAFGIEENLLALQESEIAVQNPVNVLSVMSKRLRIRDTTEAGVLLYNLDGEDHTITVNASIRPLKEGEAFIDGESTHTITIAAGQNAAVYFDIAAAKAGSIEIVFSISSDILNEKLVEKIEIEKPYIKETVCYSGSIAKKDRKSVEGISIPSFAEDGVGSLEITLDATRLGPLKNSVDYVFNYPYNCMEQQSSALLPLLAFDSYIDIFGLDKKVQDIHSTVTKTFKNWSTVQLFNGGFPYWPRGTRASFFVSLRIAHIVALAKDRGYTNDEIAIDIDNLLEYLDSYVKNDTIHNSDYLRAYYAYIRTLHGQDIGDLSSLKNRNEEDISIQAFIGMAYHNNGKNEEAKDCLSIIKAFYSMGSKSVSLSKENSWIGHGWYSNDITEDYALSLQLSLLLDPDNIFNTKLLYTLFQTQKAGMWKNTIITARVLDAIYTLITVKNLDNVDVKGNVSLERKTLLEGDFKGVDAKPISVSIPLEDERLASLKKDKVFPLTFSKKGNSDLYYTTTLSYALPEEMQSKRDEGIDISWKITDDETGKVLEKKHDESTILELESGKTYSVEVSLSSGMDRTYLALRAPIPSGAQVLNTDFVTTPGGEDAMEKSSYNDHSFSSWDYYWYDYWYGGNSMSNEQIFDNEVRYFWNTYKKGSTKATFKFRAARRGVYPVPPVTAECMYEPEIFGRTDGTLFIIK